MRLIDMLMAFPYILLALVIVAVLGPGLLNALYAIAVVNIPFFARNIRGLTVGLRQRDFIQAARLSGKNHLQILLTEVLPNVMPVVVVTMSTTVGWMILKLPDCRSSASGRNPQCRFRLNAWTGPRTDVQRAARLGGAWLNDFPAGDEL